jgi:hypothetical protein
VEGKRRIGRRKQNVALIGRENEMDKISARE